MGNVCIILLPNTRLEINISKTRNSKTAGRYPVFSHNKNVETQSRTVVSGFGSLLSMSSQYAPDDTCWNLNCQHFFFFSPATEMFWKNPKLLLIIHKMQGGVTENVIYEYMVHFCMWKAYMLFLSCYWTPVSSSSCHWAINHPTLGTAICLLH